ncbi:hypothetical protein ACVXG7_30290 [Enterobacter hormaechei]
MSRDSPDEHLCGPQETCMSLWQQNYDPAGNIWLSSLIASLPILFLLCADKAQAEGLPCRNVHRCHRLAGGAVLL